MTIAKKSNYNQMSSTFVYGVFSVTNIQVGQIRVKSDSKKVSK